MSANRDPEDGEAVRSAPWKSLGPIVLGGVFVWLGLTTLGLLSSAMSPARLITLLVILGGLTFVAYGLRGIVIQDEIFATPDALVLRRGGKTQAWPWRNIAKTSLVYAAPGVHRLVLNLNGDGPRRVWIPANFSFEPNDVRRAIIAAKAAAETPSNPLEPVARWNEVVQMVRSRPTKSLAIGWFRLIVVLCCAGCLIYLFTTN